MLLALPWKEKGPKPEKLLEDEIIRQLVIMKTNDPDSEVYKAAMSRYEKLNEQALKEEQLKESRRSRWFEAGVTGLLAGITLTAESWTPITSKWSQAFMHPFRGRSGSKF